MCGEWDVSIRRACRVLEVDTSTYHYKSRRHDQAGIEARIKDVCMTRVRYGYRRVHVMLRREGWLVSAKKVYMIYNELGLQLRKKTPKRRVKAKLRDDRQPATQPNETWAMDFVHDQLATGRKIRVLTVIDTFSRFSPIVDPRFSYRAEDVVAALEQTCAAVAVSQVDPRGSRVRVHLPGPRPVGLCQRRNLGFFAARQTDGQRLYRGLQRALSRRMFERTLVPDACGRAGKVGGLAQ